MKFLVTGGSGFIGSHTVVELLTAGHSAVVVDNLCNSKVSVINKIEQITGKTVTFIQADIRDLTALQQIFAREKIDGVIHFAGLKAVGESVIKPIEYYDNNVTGSLTLIQAMQQAKLKKLIFSSSATVYGSQATAPYIETMPLGKGTNPYASSKIMIEQILQDLCQADKDWAVKTLRYFNPIGAHASGLIGEEPQGIPNNLLPYVTQVAVGKLERLSIYGNDYPTPDGTCIRDYIHVVDLARGHLAAIEKLGDTGYTAYNLGTGRGTSVLEIVQQFEKINKTRVNYQITTRRAGDIAAVWANADKAKQQLNWQAKLDLTAMLASAWKWEQNNK